MLRATQKIRIHAGCDPRMRVPALILIASLAVLFAAVECFSQTSPLSQSGRSNPNSTSAIAPSGCLRLGAPDDYIVIHGFRVKASTLALWLASSKIRAPLNQLLETQTHARPTLIHQESSSYQTRPKAPQR